jgi:hypothetical protein
VIGKILCAIAFVLIGISCVAPPRQQPPIEFVPQSESSEGIGTLAPVNTPGIESVGGQGSVPFDPNDVAPELYYETKENIAQFINELNVIIKSKNYDKWLIYLDDDYYNYVSSPEYLQRVSLSGILQTKGIVLSNVYDYFINVVVPSRSNGRVDDIEFISENRVKAITLNKGQRLLLYDLERTQDGWKIVIPNSRNS